MTDNQVDKPDTVVSGDTVAMLYYSQGANSANKEIAELVAECEELRTERDDMRATMLNMSVQRDYYANLVSEARDVIVAMLADAPTHRAACEVARVFLDKPDAWARDKESGK